MRSFTPKSTRAQSLCGLFEMFITAEKGIERSAKDPTTRHFYTGLRSIALHSIVSHIREHWGVQNPNMLELRDISLTALIREYSWITLPGEEKTLKKLLELSFEMGYQSWQFFSDYDATERLGKEIATEAMDEREEQGVFG